MKHLIRIVELLLIGMLAVMIAYPRVLIILGLYLFMYGLIKSVCEI